MAMRWYMIAAKLTEVVSEPAPTFVIAVAKTLTIGKPAGSS